MTRARLVALVVVVLAIAVLIYLRFIRRDDASTQTAASSRGSGSAAIATSTRPSVAPGRPGYIPSWFGQPGLQERKIAGRVTFEGAGVANAEVRLTSLLTRTLGHPVETVRTDATGAFDFGPRPAAVYTVEASAPDRVGAIAHPDLRDPTARPAAEALELKLLACTATLSGHVFDSSGGPIEKARLQLAGARFETDATGAYRSCTRFGNHEMFVEADGYGSIHLRMLVTGDLARDVILVPEAVVVGRVVRDADSAPVPGAAVSIWTMRAGPEGPAPTTVMTDPDGKFRATGVSAGQITLNAVAEGLGSLTGTRATALVGQATPEIVLRLGTTLRIGGVVTSAGKPLAGAKVIAVSKSPMRYSHDAITQVDGRFTIDQVWPADNVFRVEEYEVITPKSIVLTTDRDDVAIEVSNLATLRGRTLHAGKPAPRTEIHTNGAGENHDTVSDGDGVYEIRGLRAGTHKIFALSNEAGAFGEGLEVTLAEGETKTNVDIDMPWGGTISGTVVDQDGKPVGGVYVQFVQPTGDQGESFTSLAGSFRCTSMTGKAPYSPKVYASRGQSRPFKWAGAPPTPVDVADGNANVEGIKLAILRDHLAIKGKVVDSAGAAVPDVRVRAQPLESEGAPTFNTWQSLPSSLTDGDGAFAITDLPGGAYALQARAPDGAEAIAPSVEAGTSGVKISVLRAAGIDGTLVGFSDPPVVYAQSGNEDSNFVGGNVEGTTFKIRGLAPGPYTVTAQSTHEGGAAHVELAPGQIAKVTMTSAGRGTVIATLVAFGGVGGTPTVSTCHVVARVGDEAGITNWDPATSPKPDAKVVVTFDPAPAGDIFVDCFDQSGAWSDGRVAATLPKGGRISVQIPVVARVSKSGDSENSGDVGIVLANQSLGAKVATVTKGSVAAKAGIVPGDLIVSIDGAALTGLTPGGAYRLFANHPIGSTVKLGIQHGSATRVESLVVQPW